MKTIETVIPRNLIEALEALSRYGDSIKIVAGATDMVVQVLEKKKDPVRLCVISGLDELNYIREEKGIIKIGALTTHREIERSPVILKYAPLLAEACFIVGSPQIKNLGTIGGNVVNASPVADSVPALMVLDVTLTLKSSKGERLISLKEFATGPGKTVIKSGELLAEISFPALPPAAKSFYERLGQRRLLSISKVGVAFRASLGKGVMRDVAVAMGAVAPRVIMAPGTAAFLEGKKYSSQLAAAAAAVAERESQGISDIRSTASYRNKMAGALLVRGLARVFEG